MKKITTFCFTFFILFSTIPASAQKAKLKRANKAFEDYNFMIAIELYLEVLDKVDISEAKINLAESYRKIDNTNEAEFWYGQIVHLPEAKPTYYLYYAQALHKNGKCDLAKPWFEKYKLTLDENSRKKLFLSYNYDCQTLDVLSPSRNNFYEIRKLPFNTKYNDCSPTFFKEGLIFVSERNYKPRNNYNSKIELFYTNIDTIDSESLEYKYDKKLQEFSNFSNIKYGNNSISFNEEGTKAFFTIRNLIRHKVGKEVEEKVCLKIFSADLNDNEWSNIQSLPFNSDEYSVAHPTLSVDEKTLYFSSNMPDGFGGMDLYYSTLEDGQWSPPRNLGSKFNTEAHEVFPYIHASGRLYFSSDGYLGLGGFDIYYCDNNDGIFGEITNLGFPINSTTDDYGIILNEDKTFGYFTSNRETGEGGDDIYSFKYDAVDIEVLVFDENTNEPIQDAVVLNDCSNLKLTTNKNGKVVFQLPLNKCCSFTVNKKNYSENIVENCTHNYKSGKKINIKIPLK